MATKWSIYRLLTSDNHFYIGVTKLPLQTRFIQHKKTSLRGDCRANKVYGYINKVGWDNTVIEQVEQFIANDYKEARGVEDRHIRFHINDPLCLNTNRACITEEERREFIRASNKRIAERRGQMCECECGLIVRAGRLEQHKNSYRHRSAMCFRLGPGTTLDIRELNMGIEAVCNPA